MVWLVRKYGTWLLGKLMGEILTDTIRCFDSSGSESFVLIAAMMARISLRNNFSSPLILSCKKNIVCGRF